MSKQSKLAKIEQRYGEVPPMCLNCSAVRYNPLWNNSKKKKNRCLIGGFSIKPYGTCKRHSFSTSAIKAPNEVPNEAPNEAPNVVDNEML